MTQNLFIKLIGEQSRAACARILIALLIAPTVNAKDDQNPIPEAAEVVAVPSVYDDFMVRTGNIRVKFQDGHLEVLTQEGNCISPQISHDKKVGWLRIDKTQVNLQQRNRRGVDALVIRYRDGTTKEFFADSQAPFIGKWGFADGGKLVAIQSSSYHGPLHYVLYDIQSGKVQDKIDIYVPYRELPAWAKPLAQENS
jgi:hypothetical protein